MANEFKIKNGLIVSGSADFEQDLRVRGTLTVDELHTSITTSSIIYESGSTRFGDTIDDSHTFTGSVLITGSISLNGEPIGTGKLDETTFNSFTSSYLLTSESIDNRLDTFATTGSNTFTGNQIISASLFISGGSEFGGNLVPRTAQGATLGTLERPFKEIFVSSGSINIASDVLGDPNTSLSNVGGNILVSAGGMRLLGSASFVAATGSFQYISGSMEQAGDYTQTGNYTMIGNKTITGSLFVSGTVNGNGSGITNIPITGVTNLNTISSSIDSRLDVLEAYSGSQLVPSSSMSFRTLQTDVYCKNVTGTQINKGTVVRIVGATGDNPLIAPADATTEHASANTLGITTQNIPNDNFGMVITEGVLLGVNTDGMTAGALLFLGANGTFTTTPPVAPNHGVRLGEVLRVQQNNGSIYVRIDNGIELNEAHDVIYSSGITHGDLLVRSGSVWKNSKSLEGNYLVTGSVNITGGLTGSIDYSNITNKPTLVSSSAQVTTYGFATTGSNLFIGNQTHSGSIIPSVDNEYDLGSATHQWRDVYISSGSLYIDGTKVISSTSQELQITTDNGQSIKILEGGTDSIILQTADGDIELKSNADGDILLDPTNGKIMLKGTVEILNGNKIQSSVNGTPVVFANDIVVSGSIDITGTIEGINLTDFSSSVNTRIGNLETSAGSLNSFTSSTNSRLSSIETSTGSLNTFTSSINTTIKSKLDSDGVISGSVQVNITGTTGYSTFSSSLASTDLALSNRITVLDLKTGSYATTGSNIFQGNQTITGSLYISQDLIVGGSSSIQHISSSVVNIADNIITVNAQNPSIRFGGLAVIDSGSFPQVSGSMLFDSVNDQWIFVHQNQLNVTSSVLLMGPQTFNSLGNESYPTTNRILKSVNAEHVGDSNISDNGTDVSINSNTKITGSLLVTNTIVSQTTPLVSGSGQISFNGITDKPTLVSGSSQVLNGSGVWSGSAQLPSGVVSGSSQVLSGTGIWSGSAQLPSGIVSGSSQITFGSISSIPGGLVSGSSQIDLTATTNYSTGIKTRLNAEGVLSGSSQVVSSLPSGTVSGSAQLTSAFVQKAGDTMTGTLTIGGGGGLILSTADVDVRVNRGRFQVWNNAGTGNLGYRIRTDEEGGWRWQFVDGGNTEYFGVAYSTGNATILGTISASNFSGTSSGTNTGDQTNISGNAGTVTNGVYTTGDQSIGGIKTFSNRVVFNSAVVNRPQFPGGMLGLDTGDGNLDIWGISRDYYPSHATSANAWGLRWNGDNNDFEFVGGGTNKVILDMDGGVVTATTFSGALSGNATTATTAGALTSMNISQFTNNSGYITSDSTKLPLAGGTMTGTIAFSNVIGNKIDFYHETSSSGDRYGVQVQSSELRIHSGAGGASTGGITFGKSTTTTFTEHLRIRNDGVIKAVSYYDAQASSGFRIRNAADSANVGAFTRRGLWEGNSNYDPALWAETGYGLYFYTNGSATIKTMITLNGTLLHGHTAVPTESAWLGTAAFGRDGYNKVMCGSLNSTTTGAYVVGHNSALNDWADLNFGALNLIFRYQQTERARFDTSGHFIPGANSTYNLGSASLRWNTIFTSDLSLSNGIGDYTIVEGEEKLYLYNNKNNKVYSFVLQEEDPATATPKKI